LLFFDNQDKVFFARFLEILYKYARYHPDYNPLRIVDMLLSAGADPGTPNNFGTTPLMAAAGMGNCGMVGKFVSQSPIESRDAEGRTALMYAAMGNIEDLIDSLIHLRLVSPDIRLTDFLTPPLISQIQPVYEPYKERCVHLLLDAGAKADTRDNRGLSVLMHAARTGNLATVKTLIANGADLHERSPRGVTALYAAALNGNTGIAEFLIRHGADTECALADGETPLMAAVWNGQVETVELLLKMGASVRARKLSPYKPSGDSGLIWTTRRHQTEMNEKYDLIFRILADAGAE
jgi:ankyrin repeat protein